MYCKQRYVKIHKKSEPKLEQKKKIFNNRKSEELEDLQAKHEQFKVHTKLKKMAHTQKRNNPNVL